MSRNHASGFTLIELLVVIAIIGVLSSIVISALNSSRLKANDAAIKHQLSDMRSAAELIKTNTSSYDTVCDPTSNPGQMFRSALDLSIASFSSSACYSSGTLYYYADSGGNLVTAPKAISPDKWAATIRLRSGSYFCVDYVGNATTTSAAPDLHPSNSPPDLDCN